MMRNQNIWAPWVLVILGLAVACAVSFYASWPALKFSNVTLADLANKLGILVLFALFIERTVEVFMTLWRGPGADQLEADISQLEKDLDETAKRQTAEEQLPGKRTALLNYKAATQRYALPFGLMLGLLVAACGVRALSQFVDPAGKDVANAVELASFQVADITFTGALLAGGSDPIHRVINLYRRFMDSSTAKAESAR